MNNIFIRIKKNHHKIFQNKFNITKRGLKLGING